MRPSPTHGGGSPPSGGRFEQTQWTIILKAREGDDSDAQTAMEEFARTYWPPLYRFIRREGYNREDAQDLTQAFYHYFLEKRLLDRVPERNGKFRNFLLACLKHFLSDARDREAALKRGGGARFIPLDALEAEERDAIEPPDSLTPSEVYERRWAQAVLSCARARLRETYAAKGNAELYEALQEVTQGEKSGNSYAEIAARLEMTEQAVKSAAKLLREQYFKRVREEIGRTVNSREEIDEELQCLTQVLRSSVGS